jgi:NhaP-type Na+/H+ or K+/H+ antiporter
VSGVFSVLRAGARGLASYLGRDERGQTLWEYIMVGILVLVAGVLVLRALGVQITQNLQEIINALQNR